jgi:hypothetical protein
VAQSTGRRRHPAVAHQNNPVQFEVLGQCLDGVGIGLDRVLAARPGAGENRGPEDELISIAPCHRVLWPPSHTCSEPFAPWISTTGMPGLPWSRTWAWALAPSMNPDAALPYRDISSSGGRLFAASCSVPQHGRSLATSQPVHRSKAAGGALVSACATINASCWMPRPP